MRRYRRFRTKADVEYVWAGMMSVGNTLALSTTEEQAIVIGADWFSGGGLGEATVMRQRISLSLVATPGGVGNPTCSVLVYKSDDDAPALAAGGTVNALVDEDVMYHRCFIVPRGTTEHVMAINEEIDIKAKRRVKSTAGIRLALTANAGASWVYTVASRALVKL